MKQGPGDATVLAASVRVPRSHFVLAYKVEHGGKDPDEATLQAMAKDELTHIRQTSKPALGSAAMMRSSSVCTTRDCPPNRWRKSPPRGSGEFADAEPREGDRRGRAGGGQPVMVSMMVAGRATR